MHLRRMMLKKGVLMSVKPDSKAGMDVVHERLDKASATARTMAVRQGLDANLESVRCRWKLSGALPESTRKRGFLPFLSMSGMAHPARRKESARYRDACLRT